MISQGLAVPGEKQSASFWGPRDHESLYITGADSPFLTSKQLDSYKKSCSSSVPLCRFIERVSGLSVSEVSLEAFLNPHTQLLVIGERHSQPASKLVMLEWLPKLKEEYGFTHIALEAFNHSSQSRLDEFVAGELSELELKRVLEAQWNYKPDGYINIVRKAKELGLKIRAVDDRVSFKKMSFSEKLEKRDGVWAGILNRIFNSEPSSKVLLLAGKSHSMESLTKNDGELSTVIQNVAEKTGVVGQSLLVFGEKEQNLFKLLYANHLQNHSQIIFGEGLSPYTSGLLFVKDE